MKRFLNLLLVFGLMFFTVVPTHVSAEDLSTVSVSNGQTVKVNFKGTVDDNSDLLRAPVCPECQEVMTPTNSTENEVIGEQPCIHGHPGYNDIVYNINRVFGYRCANCGYWRRLSTTTIGQGRWCDWDI